MKSKKLDKKKMTDEDLLKAYNADSCLKCVKRARTHGLLCKFCLAYNQQIARAAIPAPYTLEELNQILERLDDLWPE